MAAIRWFSDDIVPQEKDGFAVVLETEADAAARGAAAPLVA
jgi:hypothetical protein